MKGTSLELFKLREWLLIQINLKISNNDAKKALKLLKNIDKELWGRYISLETPYGSIKNVFEDKEFDKTLEEVKNGTKSNQSM